jgi:hypothetical protein
VAAKDACLLKVAANALPRPTYFAYLELFVVLLYDEPVSL